MTPAKKSKAKRATPAKLVALKNLLVGGIIIEAGEPFSSDPIVMWGRERPQDVKGMVLRGEACDGSCDACSCHIEDLYPSAG